MIANKKKHRQSRVGYVSQGPESIPVKVSFSGQHNHTHHHPHLNSFSTTTAPQQHLSSPNNSNINNSVVDNNEKIAFNYGRELFVCPYRGVKRTHQDSKFTDKRIYKGTSPSCHDFGPCGCVKTGGGGGSSSSTSTLDHNNKVGATSSSGGGGGDDIVPLLVGFTGGEIHLIDPVNKNLSKLFNEERMIDKTKVTCIRWVPRRGDMFLVSHASGNLYTYLANADSQAVLAPAFQVARQGDNYTYYTCKSKQNHPPPRNINPIAKCTLAAATGSINEFAFSPCGDLLALVSQAGLPDFFLSLDR